MPLLSIVIPHYGDPAPTLELVSALRSQTATSGAPSAEGAEVPEILVVDDHSPQPFPRELDGVTVLTREANGGFGSAVNTGLHAATGQNVLVMNSDLSIEPDFLERFLTGAQPWLPAVVSPQVLGHDDASGWVGRHFPRISHQVVEWLTPLARFRDKSRLHEMVGHDTRCVTGAVVPVDWVMGACMLIPRAEALALGGFDERFFMNCEETDLQKRLSRRGIPAVFLGTSVVRHESGGSSNPGLRRRWLVSSRMLYARKWGGERRLRLALAAASGVNFLVNAVRQAAGRDVSAPAVLAEELRLIGVRDRGANADDGPAVQ